MIGTLVGRDAELDEVEARTRTSRLVTVVGPGGVGKTSLARAVAERVASNYPLGVGEIDLTRIDDAMAVRGTLATQLGFDSFDALLSSPGDRPMLLLVDNCEHVLDSCAAAIAQVLGSCRQPVVIATSRAPLELPGESVVSLAPLTTPRAGADPATCASVQLFLRRVREAGADADAALADIEVVGELCRRLDGLPLAIEIAAARTRTMAVGEIAARLDEAIDVLDRPRFRGAPRHRSIAETIRWSRDLLPERQRRLLEELAVFAGPFTAERSQVLVGRAAIADSFVADLDDLVNASLVAIDERSVPTRYRLLDTVRGFALGELRHHGRYEQAYDNFVDHVLDTVGELVRGADATWRPALVDDLVAHFDDMADALGHAIATDATPTRAYRLCGILWAIVHQAHADEIVVLCRRTLDRWPADGSSASARAVAALATAEYVTGHPERAVELAERAIADMGEPRMAAITLHRSLGQARRALDDLDGAASAFRRGASIGHELGMTAMALELDTAEAIVVADLGETSAAVAQVEEVIARSDEIGSVINASWARTVLGWLLLRRDPEEATRVIEDALDEARRIDYSIAIAVGLRSRAYAELLAGHPDRAVATVGELLDDLIDRGALSNLRIVTDIAAVVAHRCGHPAWEGLAATTRALPISTLTVARVELITLPATTTAPLPRHAVVRVIREALAEIAASDDGATPTVDEPGPAGTINRLGDVCEFSFAGSTVAVRATKGVADLVRLIEAAGAEVHCLDLAGAAVDEPSTGETIDATARRRYEQRIRDLQGEIDEAESNSDYERAYRHQIELDQLIEHLTAAIGQGGRTRRGAGSAERARSAVTHRVRATIRQIATLHPRLGAHLTHSITTGTYCSYRPEIPTTWQIS